jgi:hypothetical protein
MLDSLANAVQMLAVPLKSWKQRDRRKYRTKIILMKVDEFENLKKID